ncbi:LysR family transcriptional regulator [Pediococcus siamensis]|uniref:LysR family transcriptional regulator n=1 Tax=Pediococcus siamensis TaxID=381829 RepID=UPI00399FE3E9
MIETYLLEELQIFAQKKTLAKTAAALNVTQPTVTRGMQKLEDEFGVQLFNRQPNRITLTETGELAAKEAGNLISAMQTMTENVRNFEQSHQRIKIGSILPGPLILLRYLHSQLKSQVEVHDQELLQNKVPDFLTTHAYTLMISDQNIQTKKIASQYIGTEKLSVNLDQFMYHANQSEVSFAELKDLSFIVLSAIGPWRTIIQNEIPDAKFLYQAQRDAFTEITKYSDFPYFSSNLSKYDPQFIQQTQEPDNRVPIQLSDPSAHMKVFANFLKPQFERVQPVIKTMKQNWPE